MEKKMYTFEMILSEYEMALEWMNKFGVRINNTRLGVYKKVLTELEYKTVEKERFEFIEQNARIIWNALYETSSTNFIFKAFNANPPAGLIEKFNEMRCGPGEYIAEKESNSGNKARNTAYELLIAAALANAGLPVVLTNDEDITSQFIGLPLFVECKRPQNAKKMLDNFRDGIDQLTRRLNNLEGGNGHGVLMFSLDKVLNWNFNCPTFETKEEFDNHLFAIGCKVFQENVINKSRIDIDKRIIAVLLQIRVPVIIKSYKHQFNLGSYTHAFDPYNRIELRSKFLEIFLYGWNRNVLCY